MLESKDAGLRRHFSSYDEMVAFVEIYREHTELYDILRYLCGLYPNEGESVMVDIDGKEVAIDASIAPYVIELRKHGYETLACCSGLVREHRGAKYSKSSPSGYISILRDEETLERVSGLSAVPGVKTELDADCYLQPAISFRLKAETDGELVEAWDTLVKTLLDLGETTLR